MARVLLAMSGGVDSSVAAYLLKQAGYEVVGVFMRHGEQAAASCAVGDSSPLLPLLHQPGHRQGCCSAQDAADARRVADRLDIPFYALNLESEFRQIVDYFVEEYLQARTPNPCVVCNNWLKFGKLFTYADSLGADFVATGHYARLAHRDDGPALLRGLDHHKDQSYVLFGVASSRLARMLFPVGDYRKEEIRRLAAELGLGVADKPDSQEICFVPDGDHRRFVRQRRPERDTSGELVTVDGRVVGRHDGIERFTVGQRRGVGVALGEPHYVVKIEKESCRVVLGKRQDLARCQLSASNCNWLVTPPEAPLRCQVQIRYRARPVHAVVQALPHNRLHVRFEEPCYGIAPGQAVVCYDGDRVLGGGWID
ncbi:MAG: tRNA-specific 2-thiouridylase MnmA [Pirellulaceae bacterium]|nr:MAG: tRNA-specific 2-thiouridylase MnmA [Pirellulaceae bacterium]